MFAQSMSVKHLEHRGSGALHNGDARQQRRAQVKGQDWACRRGEDYLLLSDNVIQLGKDRAENPCMGR